MLGLERLSTDELLKDIEIWCGLGVNAIALFPVVPTEKKANDGHYAWQEEGCIQQTIKKIKHHFPQLGIIADVALDPYTLHGQDGIIDNTGEVLNDETVSLLVKQALSLAYAGADVIAPSDMMDGRIKKIRDTLEEHELTKTLILSYSAKYASNYYGPFREAIGSKKQNDTIDKSTYQMNPANQNEALYEVAQDLNEGADLIMIKPGMPYLDIVNQVKERFKIPVCVYQVSGEYVMHKQAIENGFIKAESLLESLTCIKRAGADIIFTYYAIEAAKILQHGNKL